MKEFYSYKCNKLGSIDNLILQKQKSKKIKKNQLRILNYAIGLNFIDILMIKGKYQHKNSLPFIPGIEACGKVIEENCQMPELVGKKVIIISKGGCFSEQIIAEKNDVIFINDKTKTLLATGCFIPFITSYVALMEIGRVKKGNTLLISGASGGIGTCAITLAKNRGLKVISLVQNKKKALHVKNIGSDRYVIIDENLKSNILKVNKNNKVNVIMDINGLQHKYNLLKLLEWGGKYLIVGFMKNNLSELATNYILIKGLQIFGVRAGNYLKVFKKRKRIIVNEFHAFLRENKFISDFYNIKSFNNLKKVLKEMESRKSIGKTIIKTKYYTDY